MHEPNTVVTQVGSVLTCDCPTIMETLLHSLDEALAMGIGEWFRRTGLGTVAVVAMGVDVMGTTVVVAAGLGSPVVTTDLQLADFKR